MEKLTILFTEMFEDICYKSDLPFDKEYVSKQIEYRLSDFKDEIKDEIYNIIQTRFNLKFKEEF